MSNDETYDIICNDEVFNIFNQITTFLFSVIFGFGLSFACVAYTIMPVEDEDEEQDEDEVEVEVEVEDEETESFYTKYDEEFNNLPADGYVIDNYPFKYKVNEKTPFGDIIMYLNVYKDDYLNNNESIEYTYYNSTNSWNFKQLNVIVKKIAIELNTKQFYKYTPYTTPDTATDTAPDTATDSIDKVVSYNSIFVKFKKYNTKNNSSINNKIVVNNNLIRLRRIGSIYDYEKELVEGTKNIRNVSFKEYLEKTKND
jgi:hypothetical protein